MGGNCPNGNCGVNAAQPYDATKPIQPTPEPERDPVPSAYYYPR